MMLYYNGDLQANGFRSMLRVVNTLVRHCSDIIIIIIIIITRPKPAYGRQGLAGCGAKIQMK